MTTDLGLVRATFEKKYSGVFIKNKINCPLITRLVTCVKDTHSCHFKAWNRSHPFLGKGQERQDIEPSQLPHPPPNSNYLEEAFQLPDCNRHSVVCLLKDKYSIISSEEHTTCSFWTALFDFFILHQPSIRLRTTALG